MTTEAPEHDTRVSVIDTFRRRGADLRELRAEHGREVVARLIACDDMRIAFASLARRAADPCEDAAVRS
jgi:hypothetical protein